MNTEITAQPSGLVGPPPPGSSIAQISEYVRKVFQDRDGVYWFGTNGDGVARFDGKELTYLSLMDGLGGVAIRGILQDSKGAMWFATNGGVSRLMDGEFTNYTMANGLSDNEVWSMMCDSSGTIWVGTQAGVCRFNGEAFVPFPLPSGGVENPESRFNTSVVWSMIEDADGNIWFGTDGDGARRYDGKEFTIYTTKDGIAGNKVRCVYQDRRGRIWLGSDGGGVSCYDGTSFKNFTSKDGLGNDRIFEVLEDWAGNIWFSTLGAGASRYDEKTFSVFASQQGLTATHVQHMFEDRDGKLWFGCSGGLFRFNGLNFVNVTMDGPWPVSSQKNVPPDVPYEMADYARFVGGRWEMVLASNESPVHTWSWGPGKYSIHRMIAESDAASNSWAGDVYYWHPGRKQVRQLSIHGDIPGIGRGTGEGDFRFEGEKAVGYIDLQQPRDMRNLSNRTVFEGPDRYHDTLLEDNGAGFGHLADWEFVRVPDPPDNMPEVVEGEAKIPTGLMKSFEPLVAHPWETVGDSDQDESLHFQSTISWLPGVEAIHGRVVTPAENGESVHILDAYIYEPVGTNSLRCLALSNTGGVYEGDVQMLDGGALQFELKGYEGDKIEDFEVRLEFGHDGMMRQQVWKGEGDGRKLVVDVRHKGVEANKE